MTHGRITVREELCKGCALCISACPKEVLHLSKEKLNSKGYYPAELIDPDNLCTGCALCAVMCPDIAITVYREARTASPARAAGIEAGQ